MHAKQRRKASESIGVGAAVLALVAAPMVGTTLSTASAAAPVVVVSANFDDGTLGVLQQSGGPTFTYVDDGAGKVLSVGGRANSWDTVSSVAGVFEPGVEYTLSARVRLPEGTAPSEARFTGFNGVDPGGAYAWVGNAPVTADAWTTITGTYTLPDVAVPENSKFSVEVGTGAVLPTFLLDDVLVTKAAAAAAPTTVVSANFDDGTLGVLQQSGGPTFTYVDDGAGKVLSVGGRANSWDTVSSVAGVFEPGVEYTLSARVRLPEGTAPSEARFTGFNGVDPGGAYAWVGNAPVTADAWTTITGTYTLPDVAVPENSKFSVEVGTGAVLPTFLLDDVLVTRASGDVAPVDVTVLESGFETDVDPWVARNATVERTTTDAHTGTGAMLVSGRTANWHGAQTPIAPITAEGGEYTVTAWVKLVMGQSADTIKMTVAQTPSGYVEAVPTTAVTDAEWVQLTGTYTRAEGVTGGDLYFEAAGATTSFLVDDVTIVGPDPDAGSTPWVPDLEGFVPAGAVNPTSTPVAVARTVEGATATAALTFDDGPNGAYTTELLDFLAANDVVATFCVIGANVTEPGGAALLQRIVNEGHALCNHGTTYADMGSWTKAQVETDLKANLEIIRTALGDPNAPVPYFRAPNGSWGQTIPVAVALGMQPLAVTNTNTIADWETQDEATLTANLRASMKDGEIVLVHDGGGPRAGSVAAAKTVIAERLAAGWVFTLPQGGADGAYVPSGSIDADFEDNTLQGWSGRNNGLGAPTVAVVAPGHDSLYAARVSDRVSQGQGLQHNVAGVFEAGATYDFSAWIKFEGTPGDVTLSAHVESGGSSSYPNLVTVNGMANDWVQARGTFTMPSYTTAAEVYFETAWAGGAAGNTSTFLVDDITFTKRADAVIQDDLAPLFDAVDVPLGVAIDGRETTRSAAQLLTKHFEQITAENSMKPENWYNGRTFSPSADTKAVMDYAVANGLRVYGHVLVWHAQTPAWFFQDDAGQPLPVNAESAEIVRGRMETHIANVAEWIADEYGAFGSPTNPVVGWDVVNETISDSSTPDGMRTSDWHKYLGEEFVDRAFEYADKYVNDVYHAGGTAPRIALFINDYNSELTSKQNRYYALVQRLLARDVPIDGVGHQFHVSLSLPVSALEGALERFSGLGLQQAVTEFDVTTGTPTSEALFIEQGYYYRDAFEAFRKYEDQLFSITVWGLYDTRSWRNANGGPLVFDQDMQAKPAYYGIVGDTLPARIRVANSFAGEVDLDVEAAAWEQLPLYDVEGQVGFQTRWAPDHVTVYAQVDDAYDTLEVQVGDETSTFSRAGGGDMVVTETADGWTAVVKVPVTGEQGDVLDFDLRVVGDAGSAGWNNPGVLGDLRLVEPLSTVEVVKAASAPTVDGEVDDLWQAAATVSTGKQVVGTAGATATVRTLWKDRKLYVLADVVDATPDTSATAAHEKDSLEVFLDAGNFKNPTFRYDDLHVRIDAENKVTLGQGDQGFHMARIESQVVETSTGYRVEAAIDMLDQYVGAGTFHGLDFQVNDATDGERVSARTWADPTGLGYQSAERWGVAQLVSKPTLSLSLLAVKAGGTVTVDLAGFTPGDTVSIALGAGVTATGGAGGVGAAVVAPAGTTVLGSVPVAGDGTASLTVTIPATLAAGTYRIVAAVGSDVLAQRALTVLAADATASPTAAATPAARAGNLATTGAGLGLGLLGVLVLLTGAVLLVVRRRGHLADEVTRTLRS